MHDQCVKLKERITKLHDDLKFMEAEIYALAVDITAVDKIALREDLQKEWRRLVALLADAAIAADESVSEA